MGEERENREGGQTEEEKRVGGREEMGERGGEEGREKESKRRPEKHLKTAAFSVGPSANAPEETKLKQSIHDTEDGNSRARTKYGVLY